MRITALACLLLVSCSLVSGLPSLNQIYSAWFCGDDSCLWASPPSSNQTWLVNRGDGNPTVNIIIFAFVDPLKLLQGTIPAGFTQGEVNYYKNKNIYVIFSIGGASYASNWDQALNQDAVKLATNAANIAKQYGVGIEIDYEQDSSASMGLLTTFVKTYRTIIPFDGSASPAPESILTVDLGAGTGYLSAISATAGGWLNASLVNWANAMVSGDPNGDVCYLTLLLYSVAFYPLSHRSPLPVTQRDFRCDFQHYFLRDFLRE
eukprot:Phypoly_transcript_13614.p1 GENE.Phypoly_transcript_13614~~Phypoly_transcript_13614.p1  ORF type:complete len:262 (+),score=19.26 Phypoly_transcript_13614:133-918(+)